MASLKRNEFLRSSITRKSKRKNVYLQLGEYSLCKQRGEFFITRSNRIIRRCNDKDDGLIALLSFKNGEHKR